MRELKKILSLFLLLLLIQQLSAQNISKDSLLFNLKSCYHKHKKISFTLENRTGQELLRVGPMQPLQVYKWSGNEWVQVSMIGYCACGMYPCPPPPELLPFDAGSKLTFEWDQMETRCVDREKGTTESKWSGKGKYKVVFEFKTSRESESFQIAREFRVR